MKTIVVTGASSGLGASISKLLLDQGHQVIGVARNPNTILKSDRLTFITGDVCENRTLNEVDSALGDSVDGLVLNAGSTWPICKIADLSPDDLRKGIETSLISPTTWIRHLLPRLRKSQGKVLYTSTSAIKTPLPSWGAFTAARASMHQILASLAKEEPSITCLAVEPGIMRTKAFEAAFEQVKSNMSAGYIQWFEQVQKGPNYLDPQAPAEAFVKLLYGAPKTKSGTFCSWNDPWIEELK